MKLLTVGLWTSLSVWGVFGGCMGGGGMTRMMSDWWNDSPESNTDDSSNSPMQLDVSFDSLFGTDSQSQSKSNQWVSDEMFFLSDGSGSTLIYLHESQPITETYVRYTIANYDEFSVTDTAFLQLFNSQPYLCNSMNCGQNNGMQMQWVFVDSSIATSRSRSQSQPRTNIIGGLESADGSNGAATPLFAVDNSDSPNNDSTAVQTKDSILAMEIGIIMTVIVSCGVLFAVWKFIVNRRDAKRELQILGGPPLLAADGNNGILIGNGPNISISGGALNGGAAVTQADVLLNPDALSQVTISAAK